MRFVFIFLALSLSAVVAKKRKTPERRLVIISIDGFAAPYLKDHRITEDSVWKKLLTQAHRYPSVETVLPAVTFPAHTSMVTGRDPAEHGIRGNHPVDPFGFSRGGWTWFMQDIRTKTLWDVLRRHRKTAANIMWPVTMTEGARIRWHIPQFDRASGSEEEKLVRVLSTPGLYNAIEKNTNIALTEYSSDDDRFSAALWVWKKKKPDLMMLYLPGFDMVEHTHGPYTEDAFAHLLALGRKIDTFVNAVRSNRREDVGVLIVSDHGFMTFQGRCFPNVILKQQGLIDAEKKTWDYYFDTSGGVARLVKNSETQKEFPVEHFTKALEENCPTMEVVTPTHALYSKFHTAYDTESRLFLLSRENALFSPGFHGTIWDEKATGHTHGFFPERDDMKTTALFFGPKKWNAYPIKTVKDTYYFALRWLKIRSTN